MRICTFFSAAANLFEALNFFSGSAEAAGL
jgi:hypothetical protein